MIAMPTEDEPVTVIQGDCLDVLRSLPDGAVDHTITDPPYSEVTHSGARSECHDGPRVPGEMWGSRTLVNFDSFTDGDLVSFCEQAVRASKRWVVLSCDWRHATATERELPESFIRLGIWAKENAAPQFSGDRPAAGWEAVLMLHRPGKKRWNGGGHHAVWTCPVERNNLHPTQKPLKLIRQWVRLFTDPNDVILDPFAGSGTTGVSAVLEGRRAILIEKDAKYVEIARRRVLDALGRLPGTLFTEAKW